MESKKYINTEQLIISLWQEIFKISDINSMSNFFLAGGSSLTALQFSSLLYKETGKKAPVTLIFENPVLKDLAEAVDSLDSKSADFESFSIEPNKGDMYKPFDLTDVQYAYWVGRSSSYVLGSVSTHAYMEVRFRNKNIKDIEYALNKVIKSQPMLRCIVLTDGTQKILPEVPYYRIDAHHCNSEESYCKKISELRQKMETGENYLDNSRFLAVKACIFDNIVNLHLLFDGIAFDGKSIFIFLDELNYFLENKQPENKEYSISYRDYAVFASHIKESVKYSEDKAFILSRLDKLKKIPDFSFQINPESIKKQTISHHSIDITEKTWYNFKQKCRKHGFTANTVLMTIYSEVIALWSGSFDFTLNLTCFNRMLNGKYENDINKLIGDFTQLLLIPVDIKSNKTFSERVKAVQNEVTCAMDHNTFGTIETERALAKKYGRRSFSFPVVFTGMVDMNSDCVIPGEIKYLSTETSQVWLDMQALEIENCLSVHLEAIEELFSFEMVEDMLNAFKSAVEMLLDDKIWDKECVLIVKCRKSEMRKKCNSVTAPLSMETLDSLFVNQVCKTPDNYAVISDDYSITYKNLYNICCETSEKIKLLDDKYIGVMLPKGPAQIAAIMSVLMAGKAYVPIDCENPISRRRKIFSAIHSNTIITDENHRQEAEKLGAVNSVLINMDCVGEFNPLEYISLSRPENTAYVIFTSGSTGEPKGVVIPHKGAVNTILDVNKRFSVSQQDKTICLSNLNFDLSVYDIFGMLSCGGAAVTLKHEDGRNPEKWISLIKKYKITVWNSVPAFMQMALEYLRSNEISAFESLKLVILSGDVIPTALPGNIRTYNKDIKVVCMGGATEASIWSNYFIADKADKNWKMMPYGYPLTNQKYYILNEALMDCPDYVKGRLFIGGEGLASGYLGDDKKTKEKFITHPITKERLYDTGDNGLYWSNGVIEFIGRDDFQVKINGHRIELGEIEAAFNELKGIENSAAAVVKPENQKTYIAVMLKRNGIDYGISAKDYLNEAKKKLPEYMVPSYCEFFDEIPITINGKIDKNKISEILSENVKKSIVLSETGADKKAKLTENQQKIADLWSEVLGCQVLSPDDDFFDCGGDSLLMIKFLNKLNKKYNLHITPDIFFSCSSVGGIACQLNTKAGEILV